jgi:ankyrin repeat protein
VDLAWLLVVHGADTAAQDNHMFHRVSLNGHVDLARILVEHGAARKKLHRASIKGHMDLTRFLVQHGANATAKTIPQITSSDPGSCVYP